MTEEDAKVELAKQHSAQINKFCPLSKEMCRDDCVAFIYRLSESTDGEGTFNYYPYCCCMAYAINGPNS